MSGSPALRTSAAGLDFQNPIVLAAGTAGYGHELAGVMNLDALGGLVTKAVSLAPRAGNAAPRVAEFDGGMINAVGLANPGVEAVCADHLPWLASHAPRLRKLVNVVGFEVDEYARVITRMERDEHVAAIDAYELNLSCPNTKAGGLEFGADDAALASVVARARAATRRPLLVKLSPILPDIARTARASVDAGADAITVVNTIPGLVVDVRARRPALGWGSGGVSGSAILPVGVLATWRVTRAVAVPVIGLGGVRTAQDALQYVMAGATLVGMGTAALKDPRQPERVVRDLARWCDANGVRALGDIRGCLEWPA
ncbi:MAG TPA: dihydroorotate dehydrogenase [Gemmatimonadaceae bacterium]|nr:dihydroorotate dehydrogenase [Gemmatimonadaceae bacterium]